MEKKITKREMYTVLNDAIPNEFSATVMKGEAAVEVTAEDVRAFLAHELELLDRKNSGERKPTTLQIENENLKNAIIAGMEEGRVYTISEIIKTIPECAELNTQKVSPLMNAMVRENDGRIIKTVEKRVPYFQLA